MAVARILLGVTGGIAAYKACELLRLLVRAGHDVVPLVTPGAERFVTRRDLLRARAHGRQSDDPYPHLTRADAARDRAADREHAREARPRARRQRAHRGGARAPRAVPRRSGDEHAHVGAPGDAVEPRARCAPAACEIVGPDEGELAEGETGPGPDEPSRRRSRARSRPLLAPRRRRSPGAQRARHRRRDARAARRRALLGNRSSGRMGVALAAEARRRGAEVTLLAANLAVRRTGRRRGRRDADRADLEREARARGGRATSSSWPPPSPTTGRRRRSRASARRTATRGRSTLQPTVDILQQLGERSGNGQVLVGFGAEIGAAGRRARSARCCDSKNLDLVVYNDVDGAGSASMQPTTRWC